MLREKRFWDKIADKYSQKPVPDEDIYQQKLALTQQYIHAEMSLLEIGSGTGSTALLHAPKVRHITGIDISSRMTEIAREKAREQNVQNVEFLVKSISDLDDRVAYDMVLGMSVLHLLKQWPHVIQRVHQLLKPGGYFVSSTACLADSMRWLQPLTPLGRMLGLMPSVQFIKKDGLRQTLLSQGFKIRQDWSVDDGHTLFIVAQKPLLNLASAPQIQD